MRLSTYSDVSHIHHYRFFVALVRLRLRSAYAVLIDMYTCTRGHRACSSRYSRVDTGQRDMRFRNGKQAVVEHGGSYSCGVVGHDYRYYKMKRRPASHISTHPRPTILMLMNTLVGVGTVVGLAATGSESRCQPGVAHTLSDLYAGTFWTRARFSLAFSNSAKALTSDDWGL